MLLKKWTGEEIGIITDILKKEIPVARISRAIGIQRSTIYYTRAHGKRLPRISQEIEEQALKIAGERITYGYRRIWALIRNSGIHVNIKTVRRIMRRNSLSLPYAKHKNRTGKKDLTKPDNINRLWETDIHYVSTVHEGMAYLMSIKDCFSKKWISCEFSMTCTANDCIKAVESAYSNRFPDGNLGQIVLRTDNGPQYVSEIFKTTAKHLGIRAEYVQKHTPEDNGEIESFHNSLKTDYIWITDIDTFDDAKTRRSKDGSSATKNDEKHFGYKAHTLVNEIKIIERISVTPANVHDSKIDPSLPGIIFYRDKGYFGSECRGINCTMDRSVRVHPLPVKTIRRNICISRIRLMAKHTCFTQYS